MKLQTKTKQPEITSPEELFWTYYWFGIITELAISLTALFGKDNEGFVMLGNNKSYYYEAFDAVKFTKVKE